MVYLLFFLTGAAGLIYEMSWSRQIGIFFGHTVNAAAVVLAAYFGGMALGYALAARWSTRLRQPLRGYAWCELSVAAWALLTPFILGWFKLGPVAALLNSENEALQTGARVIAALLVLLPATIALGATLPFVAQHLEQAGTAEGGKSRATLAYALNTAGAVAGVLLATFVLILQLGVAGSSYLAAGLSAGCGIAALLLVRRAGNSQLLPTEPDAAKAGAADNDIAAEGKPKAWLWPLLAALSGFGTLGLQVLYVRLFSMTFNNSTYTFGGIVAVFLLSLAAGSWLAARWGQRVDARRAMVWACLLSAVLIPASVLLFRAVTNIGYFDVGSSFLAYIGGALLLIAVVIGLPVLVLALVLPLCWRAAAEGGTAALGSIVGRLTAANTLAATLGSLLVSFVLMPLLGLWQNFTLLAVLYYAAAVLLVLSAGRAELGGWLIRAGVFAVPMLLAGLAWLIDPRLEETAPSKGQEYLFSKDTPYGRIDVLRNLESGALRLRQNRHYNLGGSLADSTERFQSLLPLLLHPDPRRVCFMGLATGITASGAVADPRVEQITAVELIPEVAEAARFFDEHNLDILDDPRVEVKVNDARYHLYATQDEYDLIISDLFVPWHSQTGYLYTVEHYAASRERLAPGGMFVQWLPVYQLGPRELEMILNSFATVFPHTSLWRGETWESSYGTLALVGSQALLEVDPVALSLRAAGLHEDVRGDGLVQDFAAEPLRIYIGDWPSPGAEGQASRVLNTDEHPRVEFLAPITHGEEGLLKGEKWQEYMESEMSSLSRVNVMFAGAE